MAQSHPSDHRPHAKFSTSFASSSSSPSPAAAAAAASPSPSSSDVLPSHPPSITNSQAFDVGASSPHHLHQFTNQCSTRPNADETPHLPSLFYLHHHHHHQQQQHQHDQELPISHNRESHIQTESAHRMNNNNETVSTSAASKGIEQALRSYVHGGISSPPSAPPRYHGSGLGANITGGVRDQPISFLQPQEASNRFYPANSTNTLKGGFPPTHRIAPRPLSNREGGPPNGISSRGPLNHDNDLFYTADSIQSSKGGLPPSDRPPYPLSNREEGSSTTIGISTPTNIDTDRNARLSAISHSHSRFKPNGSPSPHIDHHHHPRVALDIMSDHRENTTSFLPSTHSIPEIDVAPSGNLPSSFPLNRGPFIPSSVHVESGHELIHGASKSGLLLHGSSSPAGFLSRTNNDGSSSGNSSDEGSYERQGRLPVAASAIYFLNLRGDVLINRLYRDDVGYTFLSLPPSRFSVFFSVFEFSLY